HLIRNDVRRQPVLTVILRFVYAVVSCDVEMRAVVRVEHDVVEIVVHMCRIRTALADMLPRLATVDAHEEPYVAGEDRLFVVRIDRDDVSSASCLRVELVEIRLQRELAAAVEARVDASSQLDGDEVRPM